MTPWTYYRTIIEPLTSVKSCKQWMIMKDVMSTMFCKYPRIKGRFHSLTNTAASYGGYTGGSGKKRLRQRVWARAMHISACFEGTALAGTFYRQAPESQGRGQELSRIWGGLQKKKLCSEPGSAVSPTGGWVGPDVPICIWVRSERDQPSRWSERWRFDWMAVRWGWRGSRKTRRNTERVKTENCMCTWHTIRTVHTRPFAHYTITGPYTLHSYSMATARVFFYSSIVITPSFQCRKLRSVSFYLEGDVLKSIKGNYCYCSTR